MPVRATTILLALALGVFEYSFPARAQDQDVGIRLELLQGEWERGPENLRVALLLGQRLRQASRDDEARTVIVSSLEAAKKHFEREGESAEAHHLFGMGNLFLNRNYTALQHFQIAISLDPEREEIHLGLVRTLFNLKKYSEAKEAIDLAVAIFPESESVKRLLAEVFEKTDQSSKAVPIWEELLAINPGDKELFNALLSSCVKSGQAEKAKAMFQHLVDEGLLSQIDASIQVFRIYMTKGDLRAARVELQQAVEIDEKSEVVKGAFRDYYVAQAIQAEDGENYRRAILFWERALQQVPDDWQSKYRLGLAHAELKNFQEALEYYLPLMESSPADPVFYANVADALLGLDQIEAAGKVYQLGFGLAEKSRNEVVLERFYGIREALFKASQPIP